MFSAGDNISGLQVGSPLLQFSTLRCLDAARTCSTSFGLRRRGLQSAEPLWHLLRFLAAAGARTEGASRGAPSTRAPVGHPPRPPPTFRPPRPAATAAACP